MIEKYAHAEGLRIRYCEAGEGEPVIMLHDSEGLRWSAFHELLAGHRRIIVPELPGFGSSPANGGSLSMRDLARAMGSFASNLGLEHYRLVGTWLSARIALWQAVEAPERIDALALISPAAIVPDNWSPLAGTSEEFVKLSGPKRDSVLESKLREITAPVLVVFGTRDAVIPPETGRIYRERMPNCYYILMYNSGHAIEAERPQALYQLIDDFLERGDAFIVNRASGLINP